MLRGDNLSKAQRNKRRIRNNLRYNGCPQCRRTKNPIITINTDLFQTEHVLKDDITLRVDGRHEKITLNKKLFERLSVAEQQLKLGVFSGVCDRLKRLVRQNMDMDGELMLFSSAFRDDLLEKIARHVQSYEQAILEIVKDHISGRDEEKTPLQETILSRLTDCEIMQKSLPAKSMTERLYFEAIGSWMSVNRNKNIREIWDIVSNSYVFGRKRDVCTIIGNLHTNEIIDCRMAPDFKTRLTCE